MKFPSHHIDYHGNVLQNRAGLPYLSALHGFMGAGKLFHPLLNRLLNFLNPFTLDLIGHGESSGSDNPDRYKTGELIRDLRSIFDRTRFSPMFLYGYSMGGRLALQFAVQYPEYVDGLILESSTAGITDPGEKKRRAELDESRALAIEEDFAGFLDRWQKMPLFNNPDRNHAGQNLYAEVMQRQNPEYLSACLRGFGSGVMPSVFDQLSGLDLPVLLISGSLDSKFNKIHKTLSTQLASAESSVVDGAAHRVHLDREESCAKIIETFIKKHSP